MNPDNPSFTRSNLSSGDTLDIQFRPENDEGLGPWSDIGSGTTGDNAPPTLANTTRSIAEGSAAGSNVGSPVAASDPENDTLTYSLSGTDASKFSIDSSTGQITVGTGTTLDYDTKNSYSVTVGVSDSKDHYSTADTVVDNTATVTISVTETRSVAENSAAGTNVAPTMPTTPSPGYCSQTFTLHGTDKDKFTITSDSGQFNPHSGGGQIKVKSGTVLDHEAKSSYKVMVRVTDGCTNDMNGFPDTEIDAELDIVISVTDVDEPPVKLAAPTVAANATTPKTKLDVSWTAPTTAEMSGKPAVNGYDVQYRQVGDTTWTDASYTGTATSTTLDRPHRRQELRSAGAGGQRRRQRPLVRLKHGHHRRQHRNPQRGGELRPRNQRRRGGYGHIQPQQLHLQPRLERNGRRQLHHRVGQRPDKDRYRNRPGLRNQDFVQRHRDGDRRRGLPERGVSPEPPTQRAGQLRHPR